MIVVSLNMIVRDDDVSRYEWGHVSDFPVYHVIITYLIETKHESTLH